MIDLLAIRANDKIGTTGRSSCCAGAKVLDQNDLWKAPMAGGQRASGLHQVSGQR